MIHLDIKEKLYTFYQSFDAHDTMFPYATETIKRILEHNPRSILEFGCNNGKNLKYLSHYTKADVWGMDFSSNAVKKAQDRGLNVVLGDEKDLDNLEDKSIDVIFTVSVLDHIPDIYTIIKNFERVARKAVYLSETNETCSDLYFPHDYKQLGYKIGHITTNPQNPIGNGAIYEIWEKILC